MGPQMQPSCEPSIPCRARPASRPSATLAPMLFSEPLGQGRHRIQFTADRPFVYLDHGAIVRIADEPEKAARFASVLRGRGSLMLSTVNLLELSKKDPGPSSDRIANLFGSLDDRFAFVNSSPPQTVNDESLFSFSEARVYCKFLGYPPGRIPMRGVVAFTQRPDVAAVSRQRAAVFDRMMLAMFAEARSRVAAGATRPPARELEREFSAPELTFGELMDLAVGHNFTLEASDTRDFLHAASGLIFCDVLVLDGRWAQFARAVVRRGRSAAKVFAIGELDRFLEHLEASAST